MVLLQIVLSFALCMPSCDKKDPEIIPPENKKPRDEVDVTSFKASSASDHEMIQKAIDYAAQNSIPTVYIPAGEYEIEATNGTTHKGILLRDNIHLKLDAKAVLKAIPNSATHYSVLMVNGNSKVKITGGKIVGERNEHTGTGGEWGMGINIIDSKSVEIKDLTITDCWGDAIYVGGAKPSTDIVVDNVTCNNNRRQGISVVNCNRMTIKKSIFSRTNGTNPQAGIDLEPDNANHAVTNVTIDNCSFIDNNRYGFFISADYGFVSDIILTNSVFGGNGRSGVHLRGGKPMTTTRKNLKNVSISTAEIANNQTGITVIDAEEIKIENASVIKSTENAVRIENSSTGSFKKITIKDFGREAFICKSSNGFEISDNTFLNTGMITNGLQAYVSFLENATRNRLENNRISANSSANKPLYGIHLSKQSSQNTVAGNTVAADSYSSVAIKNEGTNNQITP